MSARAPTGGWKLEHVVSPPRGLPTRGCGGHHSLHVELLPLHWVGLWRLFRAKHQPRGLPCAGLFPQNTASPGLASSTPAQGCGPSVLKFPRAPEQALSFSVWRQMTGGPPNHSRGSTGNLRWQTCSLSSLFSFAALPEKHVWATGKNRAQL